MNKTIEKRSQPKRVNDAGTSLFDDRLLDLLATGIVPLTKHIAIWGVRLGVILLIPVRLILVVTWRAVSGFLQGVWTELRMVRREGRKMRGRKE
jgi:hypothetical protein